MKTAMRRFWRGALAAQLIQIKFQALKAHIFCT